MPEHSSPDKSNADDIGQIMLCGAGAYSENTIRSYEVDLRSFRAWCLAQDKSWLPTDARTIATYLDEKVETLSVSSLRRRLAAINFAHRMSDLSSPTASSSVHLALRRASRRKGRRPKQAKGLTADILKIILKKIPTSLPGIRDAALISVGYDTLCRSSEISIMRIEDLHVSSDGKCSILIARSKNDQEGAGRLAWMSPRTFTLLKKWLKVANIEEGPLFRGFHCRRVSPRALDTCSIRRLIKRAARRAGVDKNIAEELSGHSMRVGAAQDMLVAGFDALAIMQAGGWKTASVLLRYVENASTRKLHEKRWQGFYSS